MANIIMIDGEVIGYIYDLKTAKVVAAPNIEADHCPAFSNQGCTYYDSQCPYCGNTVECQNSEEASGRLRSTPAY